LERAAGEEDAEEGALEEVDEKDAGVELEEGGVVPWVLM
jgi:hypothetical protein